MPPQQAAPAEEFQHDRALRRTVIAAAYAALTIGSVVVLAWTAHSIWPLPAIPFLFQVKFNGGLAFVAGATGLFAIPGGRRRLAQASGLFMVMLSAANILEYLTGLGLGIDQAIVADFYAAGRPHPGRLYPIACLAFLSIGTALLLAVASKRLPSISLGALESLGFLVFSLGVAGLLGHMQPGALLRAWASFTQTPVLASAGFMAMSIGVMALAGRRRGRRVTLWVPGMVCLLVLVLDLGTPRGLVAGIAYIPLIYCSQWFTRPRTAFYFASIGTVLTAFAFVVNAPGTAAPWVAALNRSLAIAVLWITAALVYRRRISERALRQSEIQEAAMKNQRDAQTALLAAIVESSEDAILSMRLDGSILTWNRAAERLFGFKAGEIIGQSVALLIPQPLESELDFIVGQLASGKPVENFESLRRHKTGKEIPVSLTVSPIRGQRGEMIGASGILRDITARRVIEKNNALLTASIVASSGDAIVSEGMTGLITSWNAGAERIFGFGFDAAIGQPMAILVPEEKREEAGLILKRLRNGEAIQQLETVRMCRDGIRMEVSLTLSPIHDQDGRLLGVSHILRDITARKRAEEESLRMIDALRLSNKELDELASRMSDGEARLKAILDSVVDGIVTIDARGAIASFNPAAAAMFEYSESEVAGQNIRMLMPEPDRSAHDGYLARRQPTGKSRVIGVGRELVGLARSGRTFPMELTVTELTLHGQTFYVGLVRDITERSRQEKALRESKELLERAGSLAGLGGWDVNLETNEVHWAPQTCRIVGVDPSYRPTIEEGINMYLPEYRPVVAAALRKAMEDGKEFDVEAPLTGFDGRHIWARSVGVVEFAGGRPVRLAGALHDITARVAERQALQEANERAAMAAESSGIGIWDWDLRRGTFSCDALLHRIFGLEPGSANQLGLEFWAGRVHPGDRPAVEKALNDGIAGIKPYDTEFRIVWDDGSIHHVKATGKVTRDADGNAIRMVGTNMDITGRSLEREALKDANERAALAAESGGIGIWDWDMRTGAVQCDALMYRLYGVEPGAGVPFDLTYWRTHVHPDDRSALEQAFQDGIAGIRPYDTEFRIVWDDGSIHHIRATGKVTRDKDGVPIRMVGTNMDITARKRAEEESQRMMEALRRSNKELDEFAYAASHDLKAPLRVIDNASKWLEEDLEPHLTAETRENMNLLRGRVARMEKLLDDLLEYSRIGRKTDKRSAETLSGDQLMEEILDMLAPPPGFLVDVSSSMAGIEVNRMPIQQILINLVSNAIKHHHKKTGRIEVSVADLGPCLEFTVRDDGPGIPQQYHQQIFNMFQTLRPRDQVEGSGMGLAMVRKYVEVSGGKIAIESAIGQGSAFRFTWPKPARLQEASR
jgi:PAS domain S-box-containing protein